MAYIAGYSTGQPKVDFLCLHRLQWQGCSGDTAVGKIFQRFCTSHQHALCCCWAACYTSLAVLIPTNAGKPVIVAVGGGLPGPGYTLIADETIGAELWKTLTAVVCVWAWHGHGGMGHAQLSAANICHLKKPQQVVSHASSWYR